MNIFQPLFLVLAQISVLTVAFQFQTCTLRVSRVNSKNIITCNLSDNSSQIDRREYIKQLLTTAIISNQLILPIESHAIENGSPREVILKGMVTLKPGSEPISSESAALYITAKPETTINAPKRIAELFAGRPPPVLTARYPITSGSNAFPFSFQFSESDITAEGAFVGENEDLKASQYWWTNDNLVVSARFDSDGIAATRDPDDLVGRSFSLVSGKDGGRVFRYDKQVEIQLQGRGIGGKFITTKQQ